jgi:hypothetical protein
MEVPPLPLNCYLSFYFPFILDDAANLRIPNYFGMRDIHYQIFNGYNVIEKHISFLFQNVENRHFWTHWSHSNSPWGWVWCNRSQVISFGDKQLPLLSEYPPPSKHRRKSRLIVRTLFFVSRQFETEPISEVSNKIIETVPSPKVWRKSRTRP